MRFKIIFILIFLFSIGIVQALITPQVGNLRGLETYTGYGFLQFNSTNITAAGYNENILFVEKNNGSDIQTQINKCPLKGCNIIIPSGDYNITSRITFTNGIKNNVHITGIGYPKLHMDSTISAEILTATKSNITSQALTADSAQRTFNVTVTDASLFKPGMHVLIVNNEAVAGGTSQEGETNIVHQVDGNVINLRYALLFDYTTTSESNVTLINGTKNLVIEGLHFNGTNATDSTGIGIRIRGGNNIDIRNNIFENFGDHAVGLYNTINGRVHNNVISNINYLPSPADGYGIVAVYGTRNMKVYDNIISVVHEGFDCSGATGQGGSPSHLQVYNNIISNTKDFALDTHDDCYYTQYFNNHISNAAGGIRSSSTNGLIQNNYIINSSREGIYLTGGAATGNNTLVKDNIIIGAWRGIEVLNNHETYIIGNYVSNFTDLGLRLGQGSQDVMVVNNYFTYGGGEAVNATADMDYAGLYADNYYYNVSFNQNNFTENKTIHGYLRVTENISGNIQQFIQA